MEQTEVVEQPTEIDTPSSDDGGSLSDHEATYGAEARRAAREADPTPEPEPEPKPAARERAADGTFTKQPKHRAKSQEAKPEDAPRIAELTAKWRTAERERDEWKRKAETPREEPAKQPESKPAIAPERFPKFEQWLTIKGNEDKDFDDWLDARESHNYDRRRAEERADEARTTAEREFTDLAKTYESKLPDARKQHADFDDVLAAAPEVSAVIERAMLQVGPEAAYWLATHPEECAALTEDSLVHPNNPAFKAAVALMRRTLTSLVAPEQRSSSSSRTAAAPTGSALALVPATPPKPPNPGRTTAMRDADEPPGDESSLAEHERAFGPKRRRA